MAKPLLFTLCLTVMLGGCTSCENRGDSKPQVFEAWTVPIEMRIAQGAFSRQPENREIRLEGLAGEVLSAQVAVKSSRDIRGLTGSVTDLTGPGSAVIPGSSVQVRYGAFLPVGAEAAEADFATCDDRLCKKCGTLDLKIWTGNPVVF